MPYKMGGGNHLQYYDINDGQYDNQSKKRINEEDKKALAMVYYFGLPYDDLIFHWPLFGAHDDEYCDLFVKYARQYVHDFEMDINKALYLLSYQVNHDKSKFLKTIGYDASNLETLRKDICHCTDVSSLTFSRITKDCLKCSAKTILKGKLVTSVWELKPDFTIRFITLIPGGDKKWK